jgi:exodeoxyribonuclease VII small subunit
MSSSKNKSEGAESSLDDRLARLEAIVAELESGGAPLEQAIERYQEGVELLKRCRTTLGEYKKRVEELSASAEQSLREYAGDPDADDDDEREDDDEHEDDDPDASPGADARTARSTRDAARRSNA